MAATSNPGTVGAAPLQNIGAYGVELKDVFDNLEALNLQTGALETFEKAACQAGTEALAHDHAAVSASSGAADHVAGTREL